MKINHTVVERFLKYVKIDTEANPESDTIPSNMKQKDLAIILVDELKEIGLEDAEMDEFGYVYATLPSNSEKDVPVICFCSHMDTAPDSSGKNVKPIIHKNYQGQDIILPDDNSVVLRATEHLELNNQIGKDIITASGKTLLGADNKAGIAEIMDAMKYLVENPTVKHGKIKVLFTQDEELGRDAKSINLDKLGADYAYTIDGETLGMVEDETFSADGMDVIIEGISVHPGFAKDKLVNSLKIAGEFLAALPKDKLSPETTEGMEGFVHPVSISGNAEETKIQFIIRSFVESELVDLEKIVADILENVVSNHKGAKSHYKVTKQYRNMKEILKKDPKVVDYAMEAVERSGITPIKESIRGGTTGSQLTFMGLPSPNIFTGGHAFHGKQEWISIYDMKKAVETIINIAKIWEEKT